MEDGRNCKCVYERKTDDPGDLVGTDITKLLKYGMLRNVTEILIRILLYNDLRSEGYTRFHDIDWILVTQVDMHL
jgi:hypothetical protein